MFVFTATLTVVMAIKCDYPSSRPIFALQLNMPTINEEMSVLNSTNNNSVRVCIVITCIIMIEDWNYKYLKCFKFKSYIKYVK